jgi:hypothetical protein
MKKLPGRKRPGAIASMAETGRNGKTPNIQRVNVDLSASMLVELDLAARELNISRQAVMKTLMRQALDQHYLAQITRQPM